MNGTSQRLGLLGLGSQSTRFYIRLINDRYNALHGGYSTCPFVMLNVDFDRINPFLPDDLERLEPVVLDVLREARSLGIGRLIIPNITLHDAVDRVLEQSGEPLHIVHPVELAAAAIRAAGHHKVTVLGTRHTMRPGPLWDAFQRQGIELQAPEEMYQEHMEELRNLMFEGKEATGPTMAFQYMLWAMKVKPALVACTELSMALPEPVAEGVFDMARIQIEEAIRQILPGE